MTNYQFKSGTEIQKFVEMLDSFIHPLDLDFNITVKKNTWIIALSDNDPNSIYCGDFIFNKDDGSFREFAVFKG